MLVVVPVLKTGADGEKGWGPKIVSICQLALWLLEVEKNCFDIMTEKTKHSMVSNNSYFVMMKLGVNNVGQLEVCDGV